MGSRYSVSDVYRAYRYLQHAPGVTEVAALHPEYRRGDWEWNRSRRAWPLTFYLSSASALVGLVRRYAGERMVCYGVNPRPAALTREDGRIRPSLSADILISKTLLLDIDLEGVVSPSRLGSLTRFLRVADDYFTGLGVARPVRASTGRGSHLLFAYPPILVGAVPDVQERLRSFAARFGRAVQQDLSRLEARLDPSTVTLRALARVYGTSKPQVGIVSRFYGRERIEDPAVREHLLGLSVPAPAPVAIVAGTIDDWLPAWFTAALAQDAALHELWNGQGKPPGTDRSTSGYDYSIARYLAARGHTDPNELGTIIALRPNGLRERCAKGKNYLARTVGRALDRERS